MKELEKMLQPVEMQSQRITKLHGVKQCWHGFTKTGLTMEPWSTEFH